MGLFFLIVSLLLLIVGSVLKIRSKKKGENTKNKDIFLIASAILLIVSLFLPFPEREKEEVVKGIPLDEFVESFNETAYVGEMDVSIGDFNEEKTARIGGNQNLLISYKGDEEDVTSINIISRYGFSADNIEVMISLFSNLITTLDDEITVGLSDIDQIENWLLFNETIDINQHKYSVDGDIEDTHYIFAYINDNDTE